jgi:uncharacterized OB-fold protein
MTIKVPFREGLFAEVDGQQTLVGCQCKSCGQIFFPKKPVCLNCGSAEVQSINLSSRGKLYTYTTVNMASEHFPPPYAIGWIQLPEGIRIFSQIRGWQEQPLKINMDMQMCVETLWADGEREVMGYVFRPVSPAAGGNR